MNEESRAIQDRDGVPANQCRMSSRRSLLLGGTALAVCRWLGLDTPVQQAQAQQTPPASRGRQEAEHPGDLRRRHRPDERQRLLDGPDGLPHAQHRPDRQGRHDLHRLLRRAELHRRPVVVHHRPVHASHGPEQGRRARRHGGAAEGRRRPSPSCSRPHGYATGQFGKNHLGDRDEFLPTVHGFDEFFGNLYHLNAEEEPEQRTYPRDPEFRKKFGPARRASDATVERRRQAHRGHRAADQEADGDDRRRDVGRGRRLHQAAGQGRASRSSAGSTRTRMHLRTHVAAEHRSPPGLTARTEYADGMVEHDGHVGKLLKTLDDLGHRRRHHRPLHDRQRPAHEHLAGRRDDAVPQREEHQLGRRLPRARA